MSKVGRNDPCPCGSGKKYKKCCGKDNMISFNPAVYKEEFNRLHEQLIGFTFDHYEEELVPLVQEYADNRVNMDNKEDIVTYSEMVIAWAIFTIPIEKDYTIFDQFNNQAKRTIAYPAVRNTFATWKTAHPSVYEIVTEGERVQLLDILSNETFYISQNDDQEYTVGDFAVGILIPYQETHEFFFTMIQIPSVFSDEISFLLEEKLPVDVSLKEVFPFFLADLLQMEDKPGFEWMSLPHEEVADMFEVHALEKEYHQELIHMTLQFWNDFCHVNNPIVRKPASYAAALDYFSQVEFRPFTSVTQTQLAQEYGTSAGTISNHYGKFSNDYDLILQLSTEKNSPPQAPMNTEKHMRDLMRTLEAQGFESEEEINEFLQGRFSNKDMLQSEKPRDIAQDLLYEAREVHGPARKKLIEKALDIYPNSPDAYLLLAEDESDIDKRLGLLKKALHVGEEDLGEAFFKENKGSFWGIVETRPYMRAKQMYAITLLYNGMVEEAKEEFKDLLELNPNDNQGNRYHLLVLFLEDGDYKAAKKLISQYDEGTAIFMFSKALIQYEEKGITKQSVKALKEADTANPFVIDYLRMNKILPDDISDYVGIGDDTEAIAYAQENIHLWAGANQFLKMI